MPSGVYPPPPKQPGRLTDAYVRDLAAWANQVLGVATTDRLLWQGERRCLREMQEAGLIR